MRDSLENHRIGALPVVDDHGILKGIISVRDLLRAFIQVLGIGEPGTLVGVIAEHEAGEIRRIVDTIKEENIMLGSILVNGRWDEGKRAVFCYLLTNTTSRVKKKLMDKGFEVLDPEDWRL